MREEETNVHHCKRCGDGTASYCAACLDAVVLAETKDCGQECDSLARQRDEARERVAQLEDALGVLRDACGHCLAANRPPNQQMIDGADAAMRGQWAVSP